jgi:hypothetical protein
MFIPPFLGFAKKAEVRNTNPIQMYILFLKEYGETTAKAAATSPVRLTFRNSYTSGVRRSITSSFHVVHLSFVITVKFIVCLTAPRDSIPHLR